jgi:hypothetical protein
VGHILVVLTVICLLACAFYVYVLFHWIREMKRKTTTRFAPKTEVNENGNPKRPYIIGSRRATGRHGHFAARARQHDNAIAR